MKPRIPQGTRDFDPEVLKKRGYIISILKNVFECFGFLPIETPAFEYLETLTGKYGEEGDRLIFKILNNGLDNPQKEQKLRTSFERILEGRNDPILTERALRYDLTIPFARFVALYQNELAFPFRRYQMQPVWRADRPQKGRYREFWQCDADIIGSNSLINEAELIAIYCRAFNELQIPEIVLKINNRKILAGMAECCHATDQLTEITIAIDKLDKIGLEGVYKELIKLGLTEEQTHFIQQFLQREEGITEEMERISTLLEKSPLAKKGMEELQEIFLALEQLSTPPPGIQIQFDCSLARGLNYYTGFIVEVVTNATQMGSLGGGGRYDDLTGLFGLKDMSGVGVSFGVDRIFDVMETLNLFPSNVTRSGTPLLFVNLLPEAQKTLLNLLQELRTAGIPCEVYPDIKKIDRQMRYANKRNIPFVGIVGERELAKGTIQMKNMASGEQSEVAVENFTTIFTKVWKGENK